MISLDEKLDNGYLSSQSQKDLERINNWNKHLQLNLEQINKWCGVSEPHGPMATSPEYSGMLYNLPRCIKACQYMQEYFESILEDIQAIPTQTYTESATRETSESRRRESDARYLYANVDISEFDNELRDGGFELVEDGDCILPKDARYAKYSDGEFEYLVYYDMNSNRISRIYVSELIGE